MSQTASAGRGLAAPHPRDANEAAAIDDIFRFVYQELRNAARRQIGRLNPGGTLTPTALVHEVYLRFAERPAPVVVNRQHFIAVAASAMRRVIIDHLRRRQARKRDGGPHLLIEVPGPAVEKSLVDVLALDKALTELESLDPQQAKIVEMRFFGGLNIEEIAVAMDLSGRTVKREWQRARTFLYHALEISNPS
jgi:RNA polymerase sigma factor (TIGR02999 family)